MSVDLLHVDCLMKELRAGTGEMPSLLETKCPLCHGALLPSDSPMVAGPLSSQLHQVLSTTVYRDQLPPLKEAPKTNKALTDPTRNPVSNSLQPNAGRSDMIAIDIGPRADFFEPFKSKRQLDDPKVHDRPRRTTTTQVDDPLATPNAKNFLRLFINCLTLRNVRLCNRQTMVLALLLMITFLIGFQVVHFIVPLFLEQD